MKKATFVATKFKKRMKSNIIHDSGWCAYTHHGDFTTTHKKVLPHSI